MNNAPSSPHLLVYETEECDADLHAQVVQAEDGGLQQEEAGGEEEAEAEGQEVSLTSLRSVERVEGGDDAPEELRLHRLRSLLHRDAGERTSEIEYRSSRGKLCFVAADFNEIQFLKKGRNICFKVRMCNKTIK